MGNCTPFEPSSSHHYYNLVDIADIIISSEVDFVPRSRDDPISMNWDLALGITHLRREGPQILKKLILSVTQCRR